jgi:hypothetical protein
VSIGAFAASFFYLAAVASWICTAVREPDDRQALRRAGSFYAMVVVGTGLFAGVVWAVEALT